MNDSHEKNKAQKSADECISIKVRVNNSANINKTNNHLSYKTIVRN